MNATTSLASKERVTEGEVERAARRLALRLDALVLSMRRESPEQR